MHYISVSNYNIKVHIKKPNGKVIHKTFGFIKIGKEEALKKAIEYKEKTGKQLWGKFWEAIKDDEKYLLCLPKTDKPIELNSYDRYGNIKRYFQVSWMTKSEDGTSKRHTRKRSYNCFSKRKLAYEACRGIIYNAHYDKLDIIAYMKKHNNPKYKDWTLSK